VSIRVLLADKDPDFLDVMTYGLRRAGFLVHSASNGFEALESFRTENPDIVLLDVSMPGGTGIQVCSKIRALSSKPIILFSGVDHEEEVIHAFEVGADDYLTKPFSVKHLVMRMKAIHRRTGGRPGDILPRRLVSGPLVMDLDSFTASVGDNLLKLTRLEFRLLFYLAGNAGRVVATERLIDFAWGYDKEHEGDLLKTHMSHIRQKLREAKVLAITIRALPGVGYVLDLESVKRRSLPVEL